MRPEAQRIAIAEAHFGKDNYRVKLLAHPGPEHYRWGDSEIVTPDYLNDRNAIMDAIRSRSVDEQWAIFSTLAQIVDAEPPYMGTPAQYSEAFLRTLNLWKP